jgi:hypothetical protein
MAPGPSHDILPLVTEFLPGIPVLDPFAPDPEGDNGVIASARGGGNYFLAPGALRTFAFTAKMKADGADGTIQGQFQFEDHLTGVKEHGTVTCLVVDGKNAWIGGIVTNSNIPLNATARIWRVVDNGEGSTFPPDEISLLDLPALPPGDQGCQARPDLPTHSVDEGNIQVKGATPGGEPV